MKVIVEIEVNDKEIEETLEREIKEFESTKTEIQNVRKLSDLARQMKTYSVITTLFNTADQLKDELTTQLTKIIVDATKNKPENINIRVEK